MGVTRKCSKEGHDCKPKNFFLHAPKIKKDFFCDFFLNYPGLYLDSYFDMMLCGGMGAFVLVLLYSRVENVPFDDVTGDNEAGGAGSGCSVQD